MTLKTSVNLGHADLSWVGLSWDNIIQLDYVLDSVGLGHWYGWGRIGSSKFGPMSISDNIMLHNFADLHSRVSEISVTKLKLLTVTFVKKNFLKKYGKDPGSSQN